MKVGFKYLSVLLILVVFVTVSAEEKVMYKVIGKDGRISFSDKPSPGAKKIVINTSKNSIKNPRTTKLNLNESSQSKTNSFSAPKTAKVKYDVVKISSPTDEQTFRANDGNLNASVKISPNLDIAHSLQLLVNGQVQTDQQKIPYFSITNLERGSHTLQVQVINDRTGETIQASDAITFYILKTSAIVNKRRRGR